MNDPRYHQLLALVLDDELTPPESEELIAWLRKDPAASSEVRKQLQLWELYSQQVRAERSSGAFADACRTRLRAETDEQQFVRETEQRLHRSVEPDRSSLAGRFLLLRQRLIFKAKPVGRVTPCAPPTPISHPNGAHGVKRASNPVAEFIGHRIGWVLAAAAAVILCVFVLPGFLRTQGVPELAFFAGAEIQIVRSGQPVAAKVGLRLQPNDVIRTTGEGWAVINYGQEATRIELEPESELKFLTWKSGKRFDLRAGKVEATVARQRPFQPMVLGSPQAKAQVLGTEFTLAATTNATRLEVTEGKVKLTRTSDDATVEVSPGHYAVAADTTDLAALPLTGRLLREYWTNLPGDYFVTFLTSHPDYPDHPSGREFLAQFEAPSHWGTNYGARIRGYLHPPKTGEYTFWIATGDGGELWLSPDDKPSNRQQIGNAEGCTPHEWSRQRSQQSSSISLVAGRKYYIEALHKQGRRDDHLAVAWQGPGREREVILGKFLSPTESKTKEKKR